MCPASSPACRTFLPSWDLVGVAARLERDSMSSFSSCSDRDMPSRMCGCDVELARRAFGDDPALVQHVGRVAPARAPWRHSAPPAAPRRRRALTSRIDPEHLAARSSARGRARARRAAGSAAAPSAPGRSPPSAAGRRRACRRARRSRSSSTGKERADAGAATRRASRAPRRGSCRARGSPARVRPVNRRRPSGTMAMPWSQKRCGG